VISRGGCEKTRQLAAEVALGIAAGDDRAHALEHAATCRDCRELLGELAALVDELALVAPAHEPPAGFETRVLERLGAKAPGGPVARFLPMRALRAVIAALAVAAVTAGAMLATFRDERRDASRYRESLQAVNGEYFDTATLRARGGKVAGNVLAYQGSPSGMLVRVARPRRHATYTCELLTRSGRRIRLGAFRLYGSDGTWSVAIPVRLREVAEVRVYDDEHEGSLTARFRHG
jgi:hypothetical protein